MTYYKQSISDFRALMFDRAISVKDLKDRQGEPLAKILAFWRRKGLLPFVESGEWMKISFMQLIWIRMLDDLRDINFPVEKMKVVCDYFFKDAYKDDLPKKNYQYNHEQIKARILAGTQTEEDESLLQLIEDGLKNERLLQFLKTNINYLSNFVAAVLANEQDGEINIFFNGNVFEYVGRDLHSHNTQEPRVTDPHITLSITHYLSEFIQHEEQSKIIMPQLLNEDEIKVLREMRKKNVKEITINTYGQDKPRIIKSTTGGNLTPQQTRLVQDILGLKNYESITINTVDEKTLSFKKTRKKV